MELLISYPDGTEFSSDDQVQKVPDEFLNDLSDIGEVNDLKTINIGPGADWIVLAALFSGLFFLGEKIESNIEAWLKIGKRLKTLFKKHNKKWIFIDEKGATALCMVDIAEAEKEIREIEEVQSHEIKILDIHGQLLHYTEEDLGMNPYSIYNKTFLINNEYYYFYVILSNGDIKSKSKVGNIHLTMFKK